jgi:pyruvate dehydrogenase E2 component (dihydrolipoamide acetyltransferase)
VSAEVAVIGDAGDAGPAAPTQPASKQPASKQPASKQPASERPPAEPSEEQATQPAPGRNQPVSMPPAPPSDADGTAAAAPRPAPTEAAAPASAGDRIKASPLARRIAADRGIDLASVQGSGPEGRVIARDVEDAAPGAPARPVDAAPSPERPPTAHPPAAPVPSSGFTDVPLTQIRKTIAKRLAQSIGPIPTFYLTTEVDMERTAELRSALPEDGRPSFNDVIIKAAAMALRQHPMVNAWWQDDRIRQWHDVHVSMAVAIDEGLITPVIRHADQKSLRAISAEARDLARRARERKLAPDEYTGGTFSISNLGMLDIDEFTAVINPPEAAILAVGRIVARPVEHGGQVVLRRRLRLTLSCDHRIVDGATGATFLKTLKQMLENPLALVW